MEYISFAVQLYAAVRYLQDEKAHEAVIVRSALTELLNHCDFSRNEVIERYVEIVFPLNK